MSDTKQPLRDNSGTSEQKETTFTHFHLHLLCNSLCGFLWLFIHISFFISQISFLLQQLTSERLCVFSSLYIFPNQKNRTIYVKWFLEVIWSKPLLMQGHLQLAAQDCIQLVFGYLQGWWSCKLLRPPAKKGRNSYKEERQKHTWASQHLKTDPRGIHCSSSLPWVSIMLNRNT